MPICPGPEMSWCRTVFFNRCRNVLVPKCLVTVWGSSPSRGHGGSAPVSGGPAGRRPPSENWFQQFTVLNLNTQITIFLCIFRLNFHSFWKLSVRVQRYMHKKKKNYSWKIVICWIKGKAKTIYYIQPYIPFFRMISKMASKN